MSSSEFCGDVFEDTASELLSTLIIAGIKAGTRAGYGLLKGAMSAQATAAPAALPRCGSGAALSEQELFDIQLGLSPEALGHAFVATEDPFAAATACAEAFLSCLRAGEHDRACNWCEAGLFEDLERKEALLETLSAAEPRRWRCQYYHHPEDWRAGEALPWAGIDFDVLFKLPSGARTLRLIVWVVRCNGGWAVWSLEWLPMRTD